VKRKLTAKEREVLTALGTLVVGLAADIIDAERRVEYLRAHQVIADDRRQALLDLEASRPDDWSESDG
jgi:hypothetical protein